MSRFVTVQAVFGTKNIVQRSYSIPVTQLTKEETNKLQVGKGFPIAIMGIHRNLMVVIDNLSDRPNAVILKRSLEISGDLPNFVPYVSQEMAVYPILSEVCK